MTLAVKCLTLQTVKREYGWAALAALPLEIWRNNDNGKVMRRWLAEIIGWVLLVGFVAWVGVELKPYAMEYGTKAIDGVALRIPQWDLPAITRDNLFTMSTFLHYGWLFLVLGIAVDGGIRELVGTCFWLGVLGLIAAWLYATLIQGYWPTGTSTDTFFWFGHWLPMVMPMDTFWNDAGVMILIVTVYGVFEHLKYSAITDAQKQEAAKVPSGALPTMNEATSDELEKGGHL